MGRAQNEILSLLAQCMFHRERIIKLFAEKPLVYPLLKMSGEQSSSIGLVCNFLKVYASTFDFLQ